MQKLLLLSIASLCSLGLLLAACGEQSAPSPKPLTPAPVPTTVPALIPTPTPAPEPAPKPPPQPSPTPTPAPSPAPVKSQEQEKSPVEIMNSLDYDVPILREAMLQFVSKIPVFTYEDKLVQKLTAGKGGNIGAFIRLPAQNISEAKTLVDNAYYLVKDNKLPGETTPRTVTKSDIAPKLLDAAGLLAKQISSSFMH